MIQNYNVLSNSKETMLKKRLVKKESPPTLSSLYGLFMLMFMFVFAQTSWAQSVANYTFTHSTNGTLEDLTTDSTVLLTGNHDDTTTNVQSIGFTIYFMGKPYTHFSANSNGQVRLHASASESAIAGGAVSSYSNGVNTLAVMAGDNEVNDGMRMKLLGTAPNRKLVLEWTEFGAYWNNLSNSGNMQLWLHEGSSTITYIYGQIYNTSTASVTRSIFISSGNTAGASGYVIVGENATLNTTATSPVLNSFPAGTSGTGTTPLPNIGSEAQGSRTMFTFTPSTTVSGDAADLTFTAVGQNNVTLNWVDNATNEVGFLVTRATDAAFTQGVATFSVASNTSVGVGTSYSLVQTGLSAGTNYYYKVASVIEGGASTGITGNIATVEGVTYYWTGATGGTWGGFSNWNTAADGSGAAPTIWNSSDTFVFDGAGTTPGGDLSVSVDRSSFTVGQIKITNNTNLTLASSATTPRIITISGGAGYDFVIDSGSTLNLIHTNQAVNFVFSGSNNTGSIAGTYIASGSANNHITTTGGNGTLVTIEPTGSVTINGNLSSAGLVGSIATLVFENGSNYLHANSTSVNYIPTATWGATATATLNGNTTGTSLTSSSTSLGNLVINTTSSTATLSAFTSNTRVVKGNLIVNSTGTGKFRAVTSGSLTIEGNLIVNAGTFDVGSGSAGVIVVKGNVTIASDVILDLNQATLQIEGNLVNNGSIFSSETTTTNSTLNFLGTTTAQTLSGTGTFTGRISSLGVSNPFGLTISTPVLTQRVNLFEGTVTGSSNITIGTGLALSAAVQIGYNTNTNTGGNFDVSPIYNLGTGAFSLLYLKESTPRVSGFEVPTSRVVANLTVDNVNGLTLSGGIIEVTNGLTLTNGIITSSEANHIKHGSTSTAGTLTGGSPTSYIKGPIVRTVANGNTGFVLFPVGKSQYSPISIAPTTTEVSVISAESFDSNTGTANASIINLSSGRRWEVQKTLGNFSAIKVRLGDQLLTSTNIPVQAASANGEYTNTFGSIATFTEGTPNTIESINPIASENFTGFLSFADSNVCSGTPTPGNTLASSTQICLGESVSLSLQNTVAGTGVSYQWMSSTDGVTYTNIEDATASTLIVMPSVVTYYKCEVTCATSALSNSSTVVMISFNSAVTNTVPAARCGFGTVTLGATPSTGSTIVWYENPTGGSPLSSGETFVTPSINENTTYYASSKVPSTGSIILGSNSTTSSATGASPFSVGYETVRTQYIVRADELANSGLLAGNITSLSFDVTTASTTALKNYTVKVGSTSTVNSMSGSFLTLTNGVTVFGPVDYTVSTSGVKKLNFTTPFNWDGTSNLVIEICFVNDDANNTCGACYGSTISYKYTATSYDSVYAIYADNNDLCNAATGSSNLLAANRKNRPNMMFDGVVGCYSPRVPVTATVNTPPALTLSSASEMICNQTSSSVITLTSNPVDYDTYVWTPSEGVSGTHLTGWTFNPAVTTNYTLTASQSSGSLCVTTTSFLLTVKETPTAITFSPAAPVVCTDAIQALTVQGANVGVNGLVNIGTATTLTTANTTDPTAFNNRYKHYWLQMVFTKSELQAMGMQAGNINGIKFNITSIGSATSVSDFRVHMGNTNNSVLTGFMTSGLTEVYSIATYDHIIGENSIVFTTPYMWDGESNIIVDVRSTGADQLNNAITYYTATTDVKTVSAYTSSVYGSSNAFVATNPAAISSLKRLNIVFDAVITGQSDIQWSPITNLYSDAAATTPYVEGANANTVYFKSNTVGTNNYTVTATSSSNCSVSNTVTVNVSEYPTVTTVNQSALCSDGTVDLTAEGVTTGSSAGLTFTYFTNAAGTTAVSNPSAVGAGIYYIKGTNTGGCSTITSVEVSQPVAIVAEISTPTHVSCNGLTNGSATVTVTNGVAPYTYLWSNEATTAGISNVIAGTYTVLVTDANGCTANASVTITQPEILVATASDPTNVTCNGASDGAASVTVVGGKAPYTYLWSNEASTAGISNVVSGTYTVVVTDANGCTANASVTITQPVAIVAEISNQTPVTCNGGNTGSATVTVTNGVAPFTYLWSNEATTAGISNLIAGTYSVLVTDANGCTANASVTIAQPVAIVAEISNPTQVTCNGGNTGSATVTVTNGVAPFTYLWSNEATTAGISNLIAGTYSVVVTDANGCTANATVVINDGTDINLIITNPAAVCNATVDLTDASIVVDSEAGLQYTFWADPFGNVTFPNPNAIPSSGTFYIKAQRPGTDCYKILPVVVVVNTTPAPTANVTTQDFETGDTVADFTVNGSNIVWYDAEGNLLPNTTLLVSGTVYHAAQIVNGCESIQRLEITAGQNLRNPVFEVSKLRLYPNPVVSNVVIEDQSTIKSVEVYNLLGQKVLQRSFNSTQVSLDLSHLSTGAYIVNVQLENEMKTVKIIKK